MTAIQVRIPEEFVTSYVGMISGQREAQRRVYHHKFTEGGKKVWLWADQPNAADNIYVGDTNPNNRSQGFGGARLHFKLVGGGEVVLTGPWHSNSSSLLVATGIDLTSQHWTFGVVALKREPSRFTEIQYIDPEEGIIGKFNRIDDIAQEIANKLGQTVYYYCKSSGGSSSGPKGPNNATDPTLISTVLNVESSYPLQVHFNEPTKKSEQLEEEMTNMFGFDRRTTIEANKCVPEPYGCGGDAMEFRDELSKTEYQISGLCQTCQDNIFSPDDI